MANDSQDSVDQLRRDCLILEALGVLLNDRVMHNTRATDELRTRIAVETSHLRQGRAAMRHPIIESQRF